MSQSEKRALFISAPPMGWNSYDYYNTEVSEDRVRANAEYMAAHLKEYGWEYIVIDIQWYAVGAGSRSREFQYIPFGEVMMDEYARLIPDPARFPSSAGGQGFAPLAEYIHSLGLKFGIHIMRGIPRAAAHEHRALKGTALTADLLADPSNICAWNPDMYGLRASLPEAQLYYNSIMELYAQWGVDFIKCDDICREDAPSAHREIELLHNAIEACGRPIVLSLSPGPAKISEAAFYARNANMWRITDDFWDSWPLLKDMFRRCELWQGKAAPGAYPDCDMLPLGIIGGCFGERKERSTALTPDEQRTMMSLWSIFGAPLMIGAELTKLDSDTLSLLTNRELLELDQRGSRARQLVRTEEEAVWIAQIGGNDEEGSRTYLALFNLEDEERAIHCWTGACADLGYRAYAGGPIREIWGRDTASFSGGGLACLVPAHGVRLFIY
ncbi:MAG: glycoside hydrolase family 27 protein [Oscillospiraceae bacterium]|nr:glycoside hydrolase family 27 protein [Lachnospiraceae bacterium]MBQ6427615.1 glycoside hydrolase family 27 protein [Oscillospiraceae bacterium]MBQ9402765.1 glycoside hydrolase family 27 protein [Clostridia bacterium]